MPSTRASSCYPQSGGRYSIASGCPITPRLQARLRSNPTSGSGGGADPVCRCQNANPSAAAHESATSGTTATVTVDFGFPGSPNVVRFTAVLTSAGWRVDDTDCGDPSSTIYNSPVRACFS